jgi:hypothetical protein
MERKPIEFEVTERIATLSQGNGGYTTELNRVTFNGNPAKLDLRKWRDEQPMKGIALTDEEARALLAALQKYFSEGVEKP